MKVTNKRGSQQVNEHSYLRSRLLKLKTKSFAYGRLAQLGERLPYKLDVIGSSLRVSTTKSQLEEVGSFFVL